MRSADRLLPPHTGPAADPVLYGVAEGLRELFAAVLYRPEDRRDGDRDHTDES